MLEINILRSQRDHAKRALQKRMLSPEKLDLIDQVIQADDRRKRQQTELDQLLNQVNLASKKIGMMFKEGRQQDAEELRNQVNETKQEAKKLEENLRTSKDQITEWLLDIPNIPHDTVPAGALPENNEIFQGWSKALPDLPDNALPHWELAEKFGLFDLKLGVKITGSGFPVYRGKGAKLQRGLINFFLAEASLAGYEEISPPLLVNEETARATGQLPDKEGQMYMAERDNLYLIPTAEVPITNILRGSILQETDLPVKMTGYTPCFRREAGSYGADVKGLNRVHQFDKVEIVQIAHPDHSYGALEEMLAHVTMLLEKLELPYRILRLCGGDLGFTSSLTYDFEVYSAAQERWLEVSSVSNFETYQSNRLMLRYRSQDRKPQLAHTLNGSALALARVVAALLENNQVNDRILLPEALHTYTGFSSIDL
ncbi:MAG: serine--tRNA ligase [Saprospiraceae bacterium]|nr:serine--tRNA ligase [Saprospiraceae bacterium]